MRLFLCLVLLALFPLTKGRAAAVPGAAVFVRVTRAADDAPSDVYEQRFDGSRARLLLSHTALPKSFRGRIELALPSPDGALLALVESDGGGCWLWSRRTGAMKRIPLVGSEEFLAGLPPSEKLMTWSPRGQRLLVRVATEYDRRTTEYRSQAVRVFDGTTGKTRTLLTTRRGVLFAHWTSDGAAVLVGEGVSKSTCRLELVSLTGKTQRLFTRPLRVLELATSPFDAALSPDGRQVAVGESSGYFLFSRDGRTKRKLALPEMGDKPWPLDTWPLGDMVFSPDGGTLAVLVSFGHGHGEGRTVDEEVWTVQSESATAQWHRALRSSWDDDTHDLLGWAPGQSALLLASRNYSGSGPEGESRKLWLQPINSTQPPQLLVDTGPRGIDMSWWGGLPSGG